MNFLGKLRQKLLLKAARDTALLVPEVALWGPEATVLSRTFNRLWKKTEAVKLIHKIIAEATPSEWITYKNSVDLVNLLSGKGLLKEFGFEETTRDIISNVNKRALKYAKTKKADEDNDRIKEALFAVLMLYADQYTQNLVPDIQFLYNMAQNSPILQEMTFEEFQERMQNLIDQPMQSFEIASDVELGRVWTFSVLFSGASALIQNYMIVSKHDAKVCNVCKMLDGTKFSVNSAISKANQYMDAADNPLLQKQIIPFVRMSDLLGKDSQMISNMILLPPFHGRCRCEIKLI